MKTFFMILKLLSFSSFLGFTFWWLYLNQFIPDNEEAKEVFSASYGIVAFIGATIGIITSIHWGGTKSLVGKALLFFSFGLLFQEFGQLSYSYYTYMEGIEIPYPSLGDIGYFGSIPLYLLGTLSLSKALRTKWSLNLKNISLIIFLPSVLLLVSYFEFLKDYEFDWSAPLVIFLDFGYPLGQAFYISFALLTFILSNKFLGGKLKIPVLLILFTLILQYISDFIFLYQVSRETWTTAGINDYLYLSTYFFMTISLIQFKAVLQKLESKPIKSSTLIDNSIQKDEVAMQ